MPSYFFLNFKELLRLVFYKMNNLAVWYTFLPVFFFLQWGPNLLHLRQKRFSDLETNFSRDIRLRFLDDLSLSFLCSLYVSYSLPLNTKTVRHKKNINQNKSLVGFGIIIFYGGLKLWFVTFWLKTKASLLTLPFKFPLNAFLLDVSRWC